jgi:translocation and assembly module TamB
LKLDGRIDIPKALLAPKMSLDAVKNESSDIEVVDGAEYRKIVEPEAPMAISGSIEVALGDKVHVDLAGARAQLGGNVVLNWTEDEPVPVANGAIAVTGEYKAYGQLLEIEDSSIRFPAVPADNPRLNIRAVREIYGSRKVEQAGVWITGTAQRPDIRLYTNPTTTEEKAFSFLVTGSDFDYAGGVGAVSLGTYVLPRLYVSYGIGLFDTGNVISGRFDLSRRWGIKASSGERDTGVDVSFTVDR